MAEFWYESERYLIWVNQAGRGIEILACDMQHERDVITLVYDKQQLRYKFPNGSTCEAYRYLDMHLLKVIPPQLDPILRKDGMDAIELFVASGRYANGLEP